MDRAINIPDEFMKMGRPDTIKLMIVFYNHHSNFACFVAFIQWLGSLAYWLHAPMHKEYLKKKKRHN